MYLFTGFLFSGKTKFIQETLEDKRFCNGERTLLLVCEEGEEEYAPDQFADKSVFIRVIADEKELNRENLDRFRKETKAERCVIEYNGMWLLDTLYSAMPENWMVYQEFMFADARDFLSYNANMRQLCYDKLKSCELVIFNRYSDSIDKMELHKTVRGASRRSDIAYEDVKGNVVYDDIQDPLPFDMNAPVIEISDEDYAVWYRDMAEEGEKYEGKTVRVKMRALSRKKVPEGCFVCGRHMMTCCVEDIQFAALVCEYDKAQDIKDDSWIILTAGIHFAYHKAYKNRGPVLSYVNHEYSDAPNPEVASFY